MIGQRVNILSLNLKLASKRQLIFQLINDSLASFTITKHFLMFTCISSAFQTLKKNFKNLIAEMCFFLYLLTHLAHPCSLSLPRLPSRFCLYPHLGLEPLSLVVFTCCLKLKASLVFFHIIPSGLWNDIANRGRGVGALWTLAESRLSKVTQRYLSTKNLILRKYFGL